MKKTVFQAILLVLFGFSFNLSGKPSDPVRLQVGDELQLSVLGEPIYHKILTITPQGTVSIPLMKEPVKFLGLTRGGAIDKVRRIYTEKFLENPIVNLEIVKSVYFGGRVTTPGPVRFTLDRKLSISKGLSLAGGITKFADPQKITLVREFEEDSVYTLEEIQGEKGKRLLIPGDRVIIGGNGTDEIAINMEGQFVKPGPVPIPKDGRLDLTTATALAGGLTPDADPSRIEVIPADGGKPAFYSYDAILRGRAGKVLLSEGDQVVVSQSPFVNESVTVTGAVNRPGKVRFSLDGKFTLMAAINAAGGFSPTANLRKVELTRKGVRPTRHRIKELQKKGAVVWLQPGDHIKVHN